MSARARDRRSLRLFLTVAAAIPLILWAFYLWQGQETRPLWAAFAAPLFFALVGLRALLTDPDSHFPPMKARTAAIIFFACSAVLLVLNLTDF